MKRPFFVDDPVNGHKVAGTSDGKTFYRSVDPSRHMLRKYSGYAIQDILLDQLVDAGIETIVLQEPTRRLVSSIEDWQDFGKSIDLGHGPQTVLPLSYMAVT